MPRSSHAIRRGGQYDAYATPQNLIQPKGEGRLERSELDIEWGPADCGEDDIGHGEKLNYAYDYQCYALSA